MTGEVSAINVSGNVVWSDLRQEGFMTFSGMAINDPSRFRYQVWIFNKDVNQKFPVDCGLFDVDSYGRTDRANFSTHENRQSSAVYGDSRAA